MKPSTRFESANGSTPPARRHELVAAAYPSQTAGPPTWSNREEGANYGDAIVYTFTQQVSVEEPLHALHLLREGCLKILRNPPTIPFCCGKEPGKTYMYIHLYKYNTLCWHASQSDKQQVRPMKVSVPRAHTRRGGS